MTPRRGRPPRAGERATRRIEVRLTVTEHAAVVRFARAHGIGAADALRLGVLWLGAAVDEGADLPLCLGQSLLICSGGDPELKDELLPARIRRPL